MTKLEIEALHYGDQVTITIHSCPTEILTIAEISIVDEDYVRITETNGSVLEYMFDELS